MTRNPLSDGRASTAGVAVLLALIVLGVAIPFAASTSVAADSGETHHVNKSDSEAYDTIQAAVDNASNGDTILVHGGTYTQTTFIGTCEACQPSEKNTVEKNSAAEAKNITIRAVTDDVVTINASSVSAVPATGFYIANNKGHQVTIRGFVFTDNKYPIQILSGSTVAAKDNAFLDSNAVDVRIRDHVVSTIPLYDKSAHFKDNGNFWGSSRDINPANPKKVEGVTMSASQPLTRNPASNTARPGPLYVNESTGQDNNWSNPYATIGAAIHDAAPDTTIYVENGSYESIIVTKNNADDLTIRADDGATPSVNAVAVRQKENVEVHGFTIQDRLVSSGSFAFVNASHNYWGSADGPSEDNVDLNPGASAVTEPFCEDVSCSQTGDSLSTSSSGTAYCPRIIGPAGTHDRCSATDDNVTVEYYSDTPSVNGQEMSLTVDITNNGPEPVTVEVRLQPDRGSEVTTVTVASGDTVTRETIAYPRSGTIQPGIHVTYELDNSKTARHVTLSPVTISSSTDSNEGPVSQNPSETVSTVTVGDTNVNTVIQQTIFSRVSRFNDGDGRSEVLEDSALPPLRFQPDGSRDSKPIGDLNGFPQTRVNDSSGGIAHDADGNLEIGFALYSVPAGRNQTLYVKYALQTETESKHVRVRVVDSRGNPIDQNIPANYSRQRNLNTTVEPTTNWDGDGQYVNATKSGTVGENERYIQLTDKETRYINNHGSAYVTFTSLKPHGDFSGIGGGGDNTLVLFHLTMLTNDNASSPDAVATNNTTSNVSSPGTVDAASFNTSYMVLGQENERWNSIDLKPNEPVRLTVTIENHGDTTVKRDIGLYETWEAPYATSDSTASIHPAGVTPVGASAAFGDTRDGKVVVNKTVYVPPHSTVNVPLSYTWPEYKYGNHTINVVDSTDGNATEISREFAAKNDTKVYVFQPATLDVVDVDIPQHHLVFDNFNANVQVQNTGDLNGNEYIRAEYGSWVGDLRVSAPGGNPRAGVPGQTVTATFSRKHQLDGSFISDYTRLEYSPPDENPTDFEGRVAYLHTKSSNNYFRGNSPFDTQTGVQNFTVRTNNTYAHPSETGVNSQLLFDHITNSDNNSSTDLYEFDVVSLRVTDNTLTSGSESTAIDGNKTLRPNGTWFASAFPYVAAHPTDNGSASNLTTEGPYNLVSNQHYLCGRSTPKFIPLSTTGDCSTGTQAAQLPLDADENANQSGLVAHVRVSNPHSSSGVARVKIVTNQSTGTSKPIGVGVGKWANQPNVIGTGSVHLGPRESTMLHIPLVIRNNEGVSGVHVLEAVPRHQNDHIHVDYSTDLDDLPRRPATEERHPQNVVPIKVTTWGDVIFDDIGPQTDMSLDDGGYTVNELCAGDGSEGEGFNPKGGGKATGGEVGSCVASNGTADFYAQYTNYGGATGQLNINTGYMFNGTVNPNIESEWYSNDWWRNDSYAAFDNGDSYTFAPDETHKFALSKQFRDPGRYLVNVTPTRNNSVGGPLTPYNDSETAGTNYGHKTHVTVLDITEPVPDYSVTDTTFDAKDTSTSALTTVQVDNRPDSHFKVWEGGTLKFDGRESQGFSDDNVRITKYKWTVAGSAPNFGKANCEHNSGSRCYSSGNTFVGSQYDGYIFHRFDGTSDRTVTLKVWDDSTLTKNGANTNTTTVTVDVVPDNTAPDVSLTDDEASKEPVWHSYSTANYGGVSVCFDNSASDNAIGIEEDKWTGISAGDDSPCRTWDESNKNTTVYVGYEAWDFADNSGKTREGVYVRHDGKPPSASDESKSCDTGDGTDGCSVQVCITTSDVSDGETGVWKVESDNCVSASANADATAPSDCKKTDTDTDGWNTNTKTVTYYDNHGNSNTAEIEASARDYDEASEDCVDNDGDGYYPNTASSDPDYDPDDGDPCTPDNSSCEKLKSLKSPDVLSSNSGDTPVTPGPIDIGGDRSPAREGDKGVIGGL